jgi:hypothetical protein
LIYDTSANSMISRSYNPACEHRRFQSDRKGTFFHDRRLGSQKIDARPGGLETCLNNTQVAALVSNMMQPADPRRNREETGPVRAIHGDRYSLVFPVRCHRCFTFHGINFRSSGPASCCYALANAARGRWSNASADEMQPEGTGPERAV